MDASTPSSPNQPVWGPPRDPLIARGPVPGRAPQNGPRRRHPAARARQVTGWAAVASSAALVGFMVTANADGNNTSSATQQPVVVTPTSPTAQAVVPTTQSTTATDDDNENENEDSPVTTPATLPAVATPAPTRTQTAQPPSMPAHGGPNSSSHGS